MDPRYQEHAEKFRGLLSFLGRIPAIETNDSPLAGFGSGDLEGNGWWIKFSIDIGHPLSWHVVQELAFVLNELSVTEQLPTVFKPTSPPPYLNGGPREYLSWVIECADLACSPEIIAGWLQSRMPNPVDDSSQWANDDEVR